LPILNDNSINLILGNSSYAVIFVGENDSTIISANAIADYEPDKEKKKTRDTISGKIN
jgi:hypothetical protein